ncbi:MAG: GntR family transcriptional regulator [Desulfomonilaceae bacterium]
MKPPIAPTVLYQEVVERLRQSIYNSELKPGDWIDEQALAESFGISRTPLREALKVLNSEGLVVLKPRRGCFVAELTEQDLDEIFPVMALLEGRCAYDAVRKAKPRDIKRLKEIHSKLEKFAAAGDVDRFYEQNYIFHDAVQKLAGNMWLQKTVGDLRKFLKLLRGRQLKLPGRLRDSLKEHRLIMAAFENQNPSAAEKIMHDHLMAQRVALAVYDAEERQKQLNP